MLLMLQNYRKSERKRKTAENQAPELTVPITLRVGDTFDPMRNVKAVDKEDGDLTNKVKHKGDVNTSKPGTYIVEYLVVDSKGGMQRYTDCNCRGKWRNIRFRT